MTGSSVCFFDERLYGCTLFFIGQAMLGCDEVEEIHSPFLTQTHKTAIIKSLYI
jgi:hypothetical protein